MLKSDYANELMLAKMEIHRLKTENRKLLAEEARKRLLTVLIGFGLGLALAAIFLGLI